MSDLKEVKRLKSFAENEEEILKYWEEIDAFKTSLKKSEGKPAYSFYDGPPFATGLPHYGHILAGTIKDVVTRYFHMKGHYVERRFGWDCHGLPIEFAIEKELGINSKEDVMKMGIKAYNAHCKSIVMKYAKEWEIIVGRLGRWIDFRNDYKTMNLSFMESVWWVFSQLWKKKLVYRGFKVMPYSTACTTSLSNFEVQQNYKDIDDPSIVITFPLVEEPETVFLAWTTTPWTLPSNLALCVNPGFTYLKFKDKKNGNVYIAAECRMEYLYPKKKSKKKKKKPQPPEEEEGYDVLNKLKGSDLVGKEYVPLFPYFHEQFKKCGGFRIVSDKYVLDDSGTGIVHQAPAFGEDDFRICMANGIIVKGGKIACPLDDNGRFTDVVTDFAGMYVKDADKKIVAHLKATGRLIKHETIRHSYPFCWRSDTPLIYKAVPSWFVKVEEIKANLLKNNAQTYWVPSVVKEKRFHNWLENARDWAISRSRYFGCPMPIWVSDDYEEVVVVGSVEELEKLTGEKLTDIHREFLDHLEIPSKMGKGVLKRVPEVFDCWFESGSMPYAQCHYPFENKEKFEATFPAEFIAEGLDQTRGWFYTLMVLGTALFDKPPFKNVIVNGLVLAEDGKKMSKRLKNYPDPVEVIDKHGADALRLYLVNSPVVRAENLKFQEKDVKEVVKTILIPWFNAYRFFIQNARRLEVKKGSLFSSKDADQLKCENITDKYILSSSQSLVKFVRQEMEAYKLYTVIPKLLKFVDKLTNLYIRVNRPRLKGEKGLKEMETSLKVLYKVLFVSVVTMAPFTPFLTDMMYQNLKMFIPQGEREDSVHYLEFPKEDESMVDLEIEKRVKLMRKIMVAGRKMRDVKKVGMKFPVKEYLLLGVDPDYLGELTPYLASELNCKKVSFSQEIAKYYKFNAKANYRALGARLKKKMKLVVKEVQKMTHEDILKYMVEKKVTVLDELLEGDDLAVAASYVGSNDQYVQEEVTPGRHFVLMDFILTEELLVEGNCRVLLSNVQQLRKKLELEVENEVDAYFLFLKDCPEKKAMSLKSQFLTEQLKTTKCEVIGDKKELEGKEVFGEEKFKQGEEVVYELYFVKK